MNIYEMYGRQSEQYQDNIDAFLDTLQLLRDLKEGKYTLEQIVVEQKGWHFEK